MLHSTLQIFLNYLHSNPQTAGFIVFLVAFSEALAVVGTVIPGSVTLTAVGALIGSHIIPMISTFVWAALGAICGDFISYAVGLYYKDRIHKIWPFSKYPNWLIKGEVFFKKHGGKSIIIGRFFGPARSLVPLIAGAFKMHWLRFAIAAIPSASVWAVSYMLPGIFLGALALELPHEMAFQFIILVLTIILTIVLITWNIKYFCEYLVAKIDNQSYKLWNFLQMNKKTHWFTKILTNPRHPENHGQLILLVYAVITAFLFFIIAFNVTHQGSLIKLNSPILYLVSSIRTSISDNIALIFTIFGAEKTLILAAGLILVWFIYKRYWRTAIHWAALIFATSAVTYFFKILIHYPRPNVFARAVMTASPSFPSGHTCLTMSFLSFLAAVVSPELPRGKRYIPLLMTALITALVGLSRIALCAHWVTDVLGGIFLGLTVAIITIIFYRRNYTPCIPLNRFIPIIIIAFMLSFGIELFKFNKLQSDYIISWPISIISAPTWQERAFNPPLYRSNRFGTPTEPFNIEWLANIDNIKIQLLQHNWQEQQPNPSLKTILQGLENNQLEYYHVPLISQLYRNSYPVLIMTKILNKQSDQVIVLRLWKSGIYITNTTQPLFIGTVSYYNKPPQILIKRFHLKKHVKVFVDATEIFTDDLDHLYFREINYPLSKQPQQLQKIEWNGNVLLISDKPLNSRE